MVILGNVGIAGWGSYIPRYRVPLEEVGKVVGVESFGYKSVSGFDEDAITMALEAVENALLSAGVNANEIKLLTIGTESSLVTFKQIASYLASYLGIDEAVLSSDVNFNTKSGSEALKIATLSLISNLARYALVVGVDVDISKPGNISEFYSSSAASAIVLTKDLSRSVAIIEGLKTLNLNSLDTWLSNSTKSINEGLIIRNVINLTPKVVKELLQELGVKNTELTHIAFTQSNWKVINKLAKALKMPIEKFKTGFLYDKIGCCGAASSLISLIATLENSREGDHILLISYGSGFSIDAFLIRVNEYIDVVKTRSVPLSKYLNNIEVINYTTYLKFKGLL
ncbi:MAG: hydroxymethylglutaryl-CoA synthase [Desulfurococcales archaeon ex4484_42]|nr:MAG: hydroxymethylglutaryl-CoA synthase [Desulfurococcales archaeon ex4484_42]